MMRDTRKHLTGRSASIARYLVSASVLCCALVSCLPDPLEVKSVPDPAVQIIVSTQIIPDQSLIVLLTRTFGALEASDNSDPLALLDIIAVNDAVVTIEGPHGKYTLNSLGNGLYGGVVVPFEAGDQYQLHIKSDELGEAHATTVVQSRVAFANIDAELFYNGYNDTLAQITYSLEDSAERNFYMINVQEVERKDVIENLLNPQAFTVLVPDYEFNGRLFEEQFRVFPRDYQPGDTIAISLSNISEEYYEFMKLRIDNRFSIVELVSEPVNYPSNVVGGKGYFNLYLPDVRFFVFD